MTNTSWRNQQKLKLPKDAIENRWLFLKVTKHLLNHSFSFLMPKAQNYHGISVLGIKRKDGWQSCIQTVVVMMGICLRQTDKYPQPIKCALLFLTIECTFSHCLSSRNSDTYHAISSAKHLIGIPLTASAGEHCLAMEHSETLCMFTECVTH